MESKNIDFEISTDGNLTEEEKAFLTEAYRNLFIKIYGRDFFDSFIEVTKIDLKDVKKQNKVPKRLAENYRKALGVLQSVQNDENIELLLIYADNELIGGARLRKINDIEASVPDVAIVGFTKEEEREIWLEVISFCELHFKSQGYETMYIEIPATDGPLLWRADELGFKDVFNNWQKENTSLLGKSLIRKQSR